MAGADVNFDKLKDALGARTADEILDGMTQLLELNVDRLESALNREDEADTTDPHVTKMIGDVMSQAERIAKIRMPLLGQPDQQPPALPPAYTEAQLTRRVLEHMEALGMSRNAITPEMLEGVAKDVSTGVDLDEAVKRQIRALTP